MTDFDPLGIFKRIESLSKQQKIILGLSVSVFILSLFFPAFYIDRADYDAYADGKYLLFLGWMGFMVNIWQGLIWFANPFYLFSLLLFIRGNKFSLLLSLMATTLAFLFSYFSQITSSESGAISKITSLEAGYKLWVASFAILFLGNLFDLIFARKNK